MKKKQNELLVYLNSHSSPQKSSEIANALRISVRSVKSYINQINNLYNKKIILSSRNGYEINRQVFSSYFLEEEQIPQNGTERAFYIIKQLILSHSPSLELFDLCDYLCVSYSTIKTVISKMNKTFAAYNVEFVCENDCVMIKGDEKSKRKLISYVICEESNKSFADLEQLQDCFPRIDVYNLRNILTESFKNHNYYLNDFASVNLLLHFSIIIDREISGNQLETGTSDFIIENENEKHLISDLTRQLENAFQIHLNNNEIFEIYMLFKANANYTFPSSIDDLKKFTSEEIVQLTQYYISQINSRYMIDLSDGAFTTPFTLHLNNLIFRAKMGRFTRCPMTQAIKMNNPIVFDIAIYIALDLMERYNIAVNEDEVAFLAMHIGAEIERQNLNRSKVPCVLVCPDYHHLSADLLNRLLLSFGNQLNVVRSVNQEADLEGLHFDLLFTAIPLNGSYKCRIVQLSPFSLESQTDLIQNAINSERKRYKNYKLRTNFHTFFEEHLFIADPQMNTKEQILPYLCDMLRSSHYVDSEFEEKVNKRENAATTAFGHIAIPHSAEMDAVKTSIAVATSKKGFRWGNNTVHLVLLLAINKADRKTFRDLYESLISLFSDDNILQEIKGCTTFKEFSSLIYSYIDEEWENE